MDVAELNEYGLITNTGSVNSAIIKTNKFKDSNIYNRIVEYTEWLDSDVKIGIRIKCILLGVCSYSYCSCGKKCKLSIKANEVFNKTCGDRKCINISSAYDRTHEVNRKLSETKKSNKDAVVNSFYDNYIKDIYKLIPINSFIDERFNRSSNKALIDLKDYSENGNILSTILHETSYIPIDVEDFKWSQRLYLMRNNMTILPTCDCGNVLHYKNRYEGFTTMCHSCLINKGPKMRAHAVMENIKNTIGDGYVILNDDLGINSSKMVIKHTKCGHVFKRWVNNGRWKYIKCPKCEQYTSKIEKDIFNMINTWTQAYKTKVENVELDIYTPKFNIAIEVDGLYWHSEQNGKDRKYHINKTKIANNNNIRLIHLYEDEICNKLDIVENRLKSIFNRTKYRLYGRKCTIEEIDSKTKNKFLNKYHIQGEDKSSIKLGAFYKNRLVAVMTFGKRRFDKKEGYELIRYATIGSFNCVGVAGKLLKYFEREYNPKCIISYADLRWSEGNLYKQLGFTHKHNSKPNYFYFKHNIRESRLAFQKHKLKDKLDKFDPNMTEWENMKANGYDRIWDCGNMVFEKEY